MNRLNFEKMDKKKLESIDDVLYTVTEGRIVRRRKNPLPALLIGVAGAGLAIWSLTASSMSEHENLASMLMLLGGGVALVMYGAEKQCFGVESERGRHPSA